LHSGKKTAPQERHNCSDGPVAHAGNQLRFADMPRDYVGLCRMHLPRPIRERPEYANMLEIAGAFAGFEEAMTTEQNDPSPPITRASSPRISASA
jgi:hypothetical protein